VASGKERLPYQAGAGFGTGLAYAVVEDAAADCHADACQVGIQVQLLQTKAPPLW
jgi:hypothetical protein